MPWTRKQVKKLLSSGSPLSSAQQSKMKAELHSNPAIGHAKKGSAALKRSGNPGFIVESNAYDWRKPNGGRRKRSSGY